MGVNGYSDYYRGKPDYSLLNSLKTLSNLRDDPNQKEIVARRLEAITAELDSRSVSYEIPEEKKDKVISVEPRSFDTLLAMRYLSKQKNAANKGVPFLLALKDMRSLLQRKTCFYTGIKLLDDVDPTHPSKRTFDRIDSTKGYTKENTVACSNVANALKNALFEDPHYTELRMTAKQLAMFSKRINEIF